MPRILERLIGMKGEKMCTSYLIAPAQRIATQCRTVGVPGPDAPLSGKIKMKIAALMREEPMGCGAPATNGVPNESVA